jgi:hypothetical protein
MGTRNVIGFHAVKHDNSKGWGLIQLSPVIEYLHLIQSLSGEGSPQLKMTENLTFFQDSGGIFGNGNMVNFYSLWIRENQSYRFIINSTQYDIGLFSANFTSNGEPQLIFASKDQTLLINVNQTGRYYLVIKSNTPMEEMLLPFQIVIECNNSFPFFMIIDIGSFIALCGLMGGLLYSTWKNNEGLPK